MKMEFTGRNTRITAALKSHVEERLDHAARALDDVVGAHVILTVEKYRHIAEVLVRRRRGTLTGRAESEDMYQSVEKAVDRIEKQVRRKREKVVSGKRRGALAKTAVQAGGEGGRENEIGPRPAPESPRLRVVEEVPDRIKPIGVEEAILLIEKAARPFVVFRNAASGRVATLYRRASGDFGLVEFKS